MLQISTAPLTSGLASADVLVVLLDQTLTGGQQTRRALGQSDDYVQRAIKAAGFTGKMGQCVDLIAPQGFDLSRLVLVGTGNGTDLGVNGQAIRLGGIVAGYLEGLACASATVLIDGETTRTLGASGFGEFVAGMRLRSYRWSRRTDAEPAALKSVTLAVDAPDAVAAQMTYGHALSDGVAIARDLVNEAPNYLGTVEFAAAAQQLAPLGVKVEILTEVEMAALGMNGILAVGQGSRRPPRLAVLSWMGAGKAEAPVALVGKGMVFDTGGLCLKPAADQPAMKADMAGAAAVFGTLKCLALRKAAVNVVGILAIAENMPGGNAWRPSDIVTSMSGRTLEIIDTDYEGRVVLADALWYCQDRIKPRAMIDLATLTGSIVAALASKRAGLFSNDDTLANDLFRAGEQTEERLWRFPMGSDYAVEIKSDVADLRTTAGDAGDTIFGAQFLECFVNGTVWAHLDISGPAIPSAPTDVNSEWSSTSDNEFCRSWAPGYGVRLLDRLIRNAFEKHES